MALTDDSGDDWLLLLLSDDPVYSTRDGLVGLDSSLVRVGEHFLGVGGGLRAVARMLGNCGDPSVFGRSG